MFIVLLDEPGLFVYESPDDATRDIEAIDAETEIRAAFDESAVPHRVEWLQPNRHRRPLFGLLRSVEPGTYRFSPAGPAEPEKLRELLEAHPEGTNPPEAAHALNNLLAKLRAA